MRWLFADPANPAEAHHRAETLSRIDAFWQAFTAKAPDLIAHISRQKDWDLARWMIDQLHAIAPDLMWEFGPPVRTKGHRLVITPEAHDRLRPLVRTLLERAPALPDWEFYSYRLPEPLDQRAADLVQARGGGALHGIMAQAQIGRHRQIDLTYYRPEPPAKEHGGLDHAALVTTEILLGEEVFNQWIGGIRVLPLPRPGLLSRLRGRKVPDHLLPLDRLKPTVDALIASLRDQLPAQPLRDALSPLTDDPPGGAESPGFACAAFQLKPAEADDYPGRADLLTASTRWQDLWQAMHAPGFYSCRFSRHGERFCYLKLDGRDEAAAGSFPDRVTMEDQLDAALRAACAGTVVGGGTGRFYSYVDFALTDLHQGIAAIQPLLRTAGVTPRAWIEFFDPDLSAEWVGIYPDSPPPPGY